MMPASTCIVAPVARSVNIVTQPSVNQPCSYAFSHGSRARSPPRIIASRNGSPTFAERAASVPLGVARVVTYETKQYSSMPSSVKWAWGQKQHGNFSDQLAVQDI